MLEERVVPVHVKQLKVSEINITTAKQLINNFYPNDKFRLNGSVLACFVAVFSGNIFALAIYATPDKNLIDSSEWVVLKRILIFDDSPANTGSWFLSKSSRLLKRKYPNKKTLYAVMSRKAYRGIIFLANGWSECKEITSPWDVSRKRMLKFNKKSSMIKWYKRL